MNKQYVQGAEDVGGIAAEGFKKVAEEVADLGERLAKNVEIQHHINDELIKNLKKGDYGYLAITLDEMSNEDKVLVISALNCIKKACHSLSDDADTYYKQLFAVIGFEPLMEFSLDKLSNLIEKDAECALFLLIEYKAFFTESSAIQTADDFIDYLTVSPKKRREFEAIVQASVDEVGLNGILSKYEIKALKEEVKRLNEKLEAEKKQHEEYEKKFEEDQRRKREDEERKEKEERDRNDKAQNERKELNEMIADAEKAVAVAVSVAAGVGVAPIPFSNIPLLIGSQVTLMASIAVIFKINLKGDSLKKLAWGALGISGIAFWSTTVLSNLLKLIPGLGTIAGGVLSAASAGIITYGMGMAFIEVCKAVKVGKLQESDITSEKGKTMFKACFTSYSTAKSKEVL